jgi:F-type H+-transporting ATPase subunit delta
VTARAAAARYARALFDVGLHEVDPERVERDLAGFVSLLEEHDTLQRVLVNPAIPIPRKRAVISEILARAGSLPRPLARLILLLADRDRLALLPLVLEAYRDRLREHQQIVEAVVTTAVPLPEDRLRAVEHRLMEATGKKVVVKPMVDPGLIGGIVTRIGSTVFDGSVVRQLARLRERLVESRLD